MRLSQNIIYLQGQTLENFQTGTSKTSTVSTVKRKQRWSALGTGVSAVPAVSARDKSPSEHQKSAWGETCLVGPVGHTRELVRCSCACPVMRVPSVVAGGKDPFHSEKKRILSTRNNRRYPHTGTIATTPNKFTGMSQKRSFSIVIVSLSSTLILSLPWALVVSPGVGRKTCPLEFRKRWRQPKVIHLKERKGNTFQGVCHSVWPTGTILPPKTEIVPVFETLSSYP